MYLLIFWVKKLIVTDLLNYRLIDGGYLAGGKKIEMKLDKKGDDDDEDTSSESKESKKVNKILF